MTQLRFHDTAVAFCQRSHTGITVSLVETFAGFAYTGNTVNSTGKRQRDFFPQEFVERYEIVTHRQTVSDWPGIF
jgi:hypothetical protein